MQPRWVNLMQQLLEPIHRASQSALTQAQIGDDDLRAACCCAGEHIYDCLRHSNEAKNQNRYAVAMCLLRQCCEAMNVMELGLTDRPSAIDKLDSWRQGQLSSGRLRKYLEADVWPEYDA